MICVKTGCENSSYWDEKIKNYFTRNNIETDKNVLIYRVNPSRKGEFIKLSKDYDVTWPEKLAIKLYDDKLEQYKLFTENNIPSPKWEYVKSINDVTFSYPVVQKKPDGKVSENVALAFSETQIDFPCILQEFCGNNDGDYRIIIMGNKAFGYYRYNRYLDFRASGSGRVHILKDLPRKPVEIALEICKKYNFSTMCFDFIQDNNNQWVLLEMSYTYVLETVEQNCRFYIENGDVFKVDKDNFIDFIMDSFVKNIDKL